MANHTGPLTPTTQMPSTQIRRFVPLEARGTTMGWSHSCGCGQSLRREGGQVPGCCNAQTTDHGEKMKHIAPVHHDGSTTDSHRALGGTTPRRRRVLCTEARLSRGTCRSNQLLFAGRIRIPTCNRQFESNFGGDRHGSSGSVRRTTPWPLCLSSWRNRLM
ncbi:hypothetical protein H310_08225 [Aphanomyces invadans]|uniref:Uncharacterized protein n=1 Tax=Aphanomyces invadans TaxID=157072 RepID=A0A024U0Y7_9STRA|nr:hypothetical protein H310_08225 [Aphanomyces invadans]ETV99566.1 hypothetical protein H310_08225 [Aphanomyces invadans]|eukprot:XP_008872122.1 hypothetical protein H310_08225 [Aphanomyces invadans]